MGKKEITAVGPKCERCFVQVKTGHNHRSKQPPEINEWGDVEGTGMKTTRKALIIVSVY